MSHNKSQGPLLDSVIATLMASEHALNMRWAFYLTVTLVVLCLVF